MNINFATEKDLITVSEIHSFCWRETYDFMPACVHEARSTNVRHKQWQDILRRNEPGAALFVLKTIEGVIVGFSYCEPNKDADLDVEGELKAAYVLPDYRGGVSGPLLASAMVRYLLWHNIQTMGCWAFDQNKVQSWYRLLGFKRVIRRNRIIENIAIPESGFIYPDPIKLLNRLQPFIDAHFSEPENRSHYPFSRSSGLPELSNSAFL